MRRLKRPEILAVFWSSRMLFGGVGARYSHLGSEWWRVKRAPAALKENPQHDFPGSAWQEKHSSTATLRVGRNLLLSRWPAQVCCNIMSPAKDPSRFPAGDSDLRRSMPDMDIRRLCLASVTHGALLICPAPLMS
ncbi:hypothetical protein CCHR01_07526 [Colletotrichum chrysophilum]|uniref:Uncharacterized protein n=1 Tax=Colletotrichum chrysophilum TaxID=1836956 RepID=A0AAD9AK15_9PEZI|nr:hypothetical protein CCHR01_07526 [Colletotrichum chrysophilum]